MTKYIQGGTHEGWRIRDEVLFREGCKVKNKFIKRKGGYFNVKDKYTKMPWKKLVMLYNRVKGDS
jgi:hypothetical protein